MSQVIINQHYWYHMPTKIAKLKNHWKKSTHTRYCIL